MSQGCLEGIHAELDWWRPRQGIHECIRRPSGAVRQPHIYITKFSRADAQARETSAGPKSHSHNRRAGCERRDDGPCHRPDDDRLSLPDPDDVDAAVRQHSLAKGTFVVAGNDLSPGAGEIAREPTWRRVLQILCPRHPKAPGPRLLQPIEIDTVVT